MRKYALTIIRAHGQHYLIAPLGDDKKTDEIRFELVDKAIKKINPTNPNHSQ